MSELIDKFRAESERVLNAATGDGITLRLMGALAFITRCPKYLYLHEKLGRILTDIDYAGYSKQNNAVEKLFTRLGYEPWPGNSIMRGRRLIFEHPSLKLHSDVFFDKLEMCHDIKLVGRLEIDYPTLTLVDLLLEKMQIVNINEKDVVDTMMLLREHELGDSDKEQISIRYLAGLCSTDWGLWKTVTTNLGDILQRVQEGTDLQAEDRSVIESKLKRILDRIGKEPKSAGWKMRARIGEKKKWYRDVEEVER